LYLVRDSSIAFESSTFHFLNLTTKWTMHDSVREALSGAFAGASSKTLMAPLDRLKLVGQQLRGSIQQTSTPSQYEGPWKALTKIVQEEGCLALWRGNDDDDDDDDDDQKKNGEEF
jgi:hypothetical protein